MILYFNTNKLLIFHTKPDKQVVSRELRHFILLIFVYYIITVGIVAVIKIFSGEIYSGSLLAGVITMALTYLILFDRLIFISRIRIKDGFTMIYFT